MENHKTSKASSARTRCVTLNTSLYKGEAFCFLLYDGDNGHYCIPIYKVSVD